MHALETIGIKQWDKTLCSQQKNLKK
jgi:hypothetical protein